MPQKDRAAKAAYMRSYTKRRRDSDPVYADRQRERNRQSSIRRHGLTIERYEEMFERQGGMCAICGEPPP